MHRVIVHSHYCRPDVARMLWSNRGPTKKTHKGKDVNPIDTGIFPFHVFFIKTSTTLDQVSTRNQQNNYYHVVDVLVAKYQPPKQWNLSLYSARPPFFLWLVPSTPRVHRVIVHSQECRPDAARMLRSNRGPKKNKNKKYNTWNALDMGMSLFSCFLYWTKDQTGPSFDQVTTE